MPDALSMRAFEEGVGVRHDEDLLVARARQHAPDVGGLEALALLGVELEVQLDLDIVVERSRIALASSGVMVMVGARVPTAPSGSDRASPGNPISTMMIAAPASSARLTAPLQSAE